MRMEYTIKSKYEKIALHFTTFKFDPTPEHKKKLDSFVTIKFGYPICIERLSTYEFALVCYGLFQMKRKDEKYDRLKKEFENLRGEFHDG